MKSAIIALAYFIIFISFQRCDYVEVLNQEGSYIETEEWLDEFTSIRVETHIKLILEQTTEHTALISGMDLKVNNVLLKVENKELIISEKASALNRKDQLATVHLPVNVIDRITLNTPTQLRSANELSFDKLVIIVNGGGTYSDSNLKLNCQSILLAAFGPNSGLHQLSGSTNHLHLAMEGLAWTDASQLISSTVIVQQRSLKSSYVQAIDQLTVNMYSSGNVYFTGQPFLKYTTIQPDWDVEFGDAIRETD